MSNKTKNGLTVSGLKIIACISMIIDHFTWCFVPQTTSGGSLSLWYLLGRALGRPAFIIFSFVLVESFFYTHNRKNFLFRLIILALIAEAPFDFMIRHSFSLESLHDQNVLWTFAISFSALMVIDYVKSRYFLKVNSVYYFWSVIAIVVAIVVADSAFVDYRGVGVMCVLVFYFLRGNKMGLVIGMIAWSIVALFNGFDMEWLGIIALWPILMFYKGEKGGVSKYFFYIFYPVHMLILSGAAWLLSGGI